MKQQLRDAQIEINKLKEENVQLRQDLDSSPNKRMQNARGEGTFVTSGSEDPNQICDNW